MFFTSFCNFVAFITLFISIAIVIGPTPPGTGVIYDVFSFAPSFSYFLPTAIRLFLRAIYYDSNLKQKVTFLLFFYQEYNQPHYDASLRKKGKQMPPIVIFKYTSYVYFNILFFHIIPQAPKITDQPFSVFFRKISHFQYHIYFFWTINNKDFFIRLK